MRTRTGFLVVPALVAAFTLTPNLHAQPLVSIETVAVGDPGNAAYTTGYGAVTNVFAIGKYEVTIAQYTTFLNSVAKGDPHGLYSSTMASDLNTAGIARTGVSGSFNYSVLGPFGSTAMLTVSPSLRPVAYVSWFDAARFANWMHNGATNGASTETGAYTLNGTSSGIVSRNASATWWIPSEDEWVKAGYYKGGSLNAGYWLFPTQRSGAPGNAGGGINNANFFAGDFTTTASTNYSSSQNYLTTVGQFWSAGYANSSAYGTFDQGGNLGEWNDSIIDGLSRGVRGGDWSNSSSLLSISARGSLAPDSESALVGFRLATVPEPSTYALLLMTAAGALWMTRRRR